MEPNRIMLVHYHEIGLKGRNRSTFENCLLRNLESILSHAPIAEMKRISGRLLVVFSSPCSDKEACEVAEVASRIPGVARVSTGYRCERDIDSIGSTAVRALAEAGPFGSFKVAARRNHTDFEVDSMQMNALVGEVLCNAYPSKKVIMRDPDIVVHVEVIQACAYVYARTVRGIGGLPVGSGGKVVCLLSSGIDSPVATWRIARRGAVCVALHFSGRPQSDARSELLADDIAHVLEKSGCIARLYIAPIGDYQRQIAAVAPAGLRVILYRRLMLGVACEIARREGARALVTGESLGQVASQTLDNIAATDQIANLPVLRPLIGSDKLEIIADAQNLGTFDISTQDASDCCTLFMPRNPETHARLPEVLEAQKGLPFDSWMREIADTCEVKDYRCASYSPSNFLLRSDSRG